MEFPGLKKYKDLNLWNGELKDQMNEVSFSGYQFILCKIKRLELSPYNRLLKVDSLSEKTFLDGRRELEPQTLTLGIIHPDREETSNTTTCLSLLPMTLNPMLSDSNWRLPQAYPYISKWMLVTSLLDTVNDAVYA